MEGIFILGPDSLDIVAEKINATRLDIPDDYASNLDADTDSQFAYHLALQTRLSLELLGVNALCPIVFITELSYKSFIKQYEDSTLFSTGKLYVMNLSSLQNKLPYVQPMEIDNANAKSRIEKIR